MTVYTIQNGIYIHRLQTTKNLLICSNDITVGPIQAGPEGGTSTIVLFIESVFCI